MTFSTAASEWGAIIAGAHPFFLWRSGLLHYVYLLTFRLYSCTAFSPTECSFR